MAEGKTSVTHLADEVGPSRQELDDLLFAKAKLTKADLNVWRRTQLFDSHCYARLHAAQGAGLALHFRSVGPEWNFVVACNSRPSVRGLRWLTNRLRRRVSFR